MHILRCQRMATAGRNSLSERMCRLFDEDFEIIALPDITMSTAPTARGMEGGRKRCTAICRKVASAALTGTKDIEIWGDGEQTRSFTYIDDCVKGTQLHRAWNISRSC